MSSFNFEVYFLKAGQLKNTIKRSTCKYCKLISEAILLFDTIEPTKDIVIGPLKYNNRTYNKIVACDWFSARLFAT